MTKKTVYVVDDEKDVCELLKITLETRGLRVFCAHDGRAGLELLKSKRPDMLIIDLKMPKMNGYEVINAIKTDDHLKDLPIIVVTSLTQESNKTDDYWKKSLEVRDFITKPFSPIDLAKKVDAFLNNADSSEEQVLPEQSSQEQSPQEQSPQEQPSQEQPMSGN